MPAKKPAVKVSNTKLKSRSQSFWTRKSTGIIILATIAIGVGILIQSFAATNAPTGVVDIDATTNMWSPGVVQVAALQGLGVAHVSRVGCTTSGCLSAAWNNRGPALKNINISYIYNGPIPETQGTFKTVGLIIGGTGTDNKYYYQTKPCSTDNCDTGTWSNWVPAGGNTTFTLNGVSTQQTTLTPAWGGCALINAIGSDREVYTKSVCPFGNATKYAFDWKPDRNDAYSFAAKRKKLFKSNDGDVLTVNDLNQINFLDAFNGLDGGQYGGGQIRNDSDRPASYFSTASGSSRVGGVWSDGTIKTSNGSGNWTQAFTNATNVRDIYAVRNKNLSVVRTANNAAYLINAAPTYGSTSAPSVVSLGGNSIKMRVSSNIIVSIGTDGKVYYRPFTNAPSSASWKAL